MKTKSERMEELYNYAKEKGLCKNRKTFAELIDANPTNIGKAFQENSPYLTDKLLHRINAALDYAFNPIWLSTGEGDVFSNNTISDSDVGVSVGENNVSGNNNSVGVPPKNFEHEEKWFSTMNDMLQELRAQREESARQIDRLLSIIEKQQNK